MNINLVKDNICNLLYIFEKYGTDLDKLSLSNKKAIAQLSENLIEGLKCVIFKTNKSINKEVLPADLFNKMYSLD